LPTQLTSFVGRERELAELKRLLGSSRLVTMTGAGGSGKTRLSLQVAQGCASSFPHGTWFVDLAPLTDADSVTRALGSAIDVREGASRSLRHAIVEALAERILLIVLDNCEHLLEACAPLVEDLLRSCPGVRVLATSRQALHIPGEIVWR